MNLSFAGCGFLGIYHVGVAVCFRKYAPHLLLNNISGASAGAIAACCLLCDLPLGDMVSDVLRVCVEARTRTLGPFSPSFNVQAILIEGLEKFLPEDVHLRVSGKLHISLTRICDGKNVIVSHFESKQDLLNALLASAFIPFFSGWLPPSFHGVRYMDGGFSDNLPTLDENTITVSPFCGESDICPRDDSSQLFHINVANTSIELSKQNIYRFARILFPPKPEILSNMCKQGFDDALRFLHRNNLISCTRCIAVQSTFIVSESIENNTDYDPQCSECKIHRQGFDDALRFLHRNNLISCTRCIAVQSTFIVSESIENNTDYDPQCSECKIHRQEALVSNMPDTVVSIFQDAIDSANKGLVNWIFKHRGMKLLSVLTLPYTLPADIVYATFNKLNLIPTIKRTPGMLLTRLTETDFINYIGQSIETHSYHYNLMGKLLINKRSGLAFQADLEPNEYRRFVAAAPAMGNSLWDMSKFIMEQMSTLLNNTANFDRHGQQHAKLSCQLAITEYGGRNTFDVESHQNGGSMTTKNQVNLNFTLNLDDSNQTTASNNHQTTLTTRKQPNVTISKTEQLIDDDTFEQILKVTAQHDAVMAYYYTDENNKVKVTEIYDVTDSEHVDMQTLNERETNMHLEYDDDCCDDWNDGQDMFNDDQYSISDLSIEDFIDRENSSIFSDPESEWTSTEKRENHGKLSLEPSDSRPESDQPQDSTTITPTQSQPQLSQPQLSQPQLSQPPVYLKPFQLGAMSYENIDDEF